MHIEIYLDDFIGVVQGGTAEQTLINCHLLCSIDDLFRPNNIQDRAREEYISLQKLAKGDTRWNTTKAGPSLGNRHRKVGALPDPNKKRETVLGP